jgi:hypothetical protein
MNVGVSLTDAGDSIRYPSSCRPVSFREGRSMLKLRDIMTRDVTTLSSDLTLRDAMELLLTRHVSGAPVVFGGKVVGVISATDLLSFTASQSGKEEGATDEDGLDVWESEPESEDGAEPSGAYFTETWSDTGDELNELRFNDLVGRELGAGATGEDAATVHPGRLLSLPESPSLSDRARPQSPVCSSHPPRSSKSCSLPNT